MQRCHFVYFEKNNIPTAAGCMTNLEGVELLLLLARASDPPVEASIMSFLHVRIKFFQGCHSASAERHKIPLKALLNNQQAPGLRACSYSVINTMLNRHWYKPCVSIQT